MLDISALDHFLLFFTAIIALYLTFSRTLHASGICGAIALACTIVISDAHFRLANIVFSPGTNPQYITVGLCVVAAAAISLRAAIGPRSVDRLIMTFVMCSVLGTSALFHHVLVATVLPAWARDGAWTNSFLLELEPEQYRAECGSVGLDCTIGAELVPETIRADIRDRVMSIKAHFDREAPGEAAAHGFGHFNDLGDDGVASVLVYSAPGDVRVIVDEQTGSRIHRTVRDGFYLLATTAHSVWIFGGLALIAFHRRRFKRKSEREYQLRGATYSVPQRQ
jgi:hypothetical protein